MTAQPQPQSSEPTTNDGLVHVFCCIYDLGLCGTDLTDVPEVLEDEITCVVCHDLRDQPCERCGS